MKEFEPYAKANYASYIEAMISWFVRIHIFSLTISSSLYDTSLDIAIEFAIKHRVPVEKYVKQCKVTNSLGLEKN